MSDEWTEVTPKSRQEWYDETMGTIISEGEHVVYTDGEVRKFVGDRLVFVGKVDLDKVNEAMRALMEAQVDMPLSIALDE